MTENLSIKDNNIDIIALQFPDNVRLRPGKLIGSTDNPDVILREIIDNAKDEAFGSTLCNYIYIDTESGRKGGMYTIADNGRGIPISMDSTGITKTRLAVTTVDAGSKFKKDLDSVSVGMNGCGMSATAALSESFIIMSKVTEQNYQQSIPEVRIAWESAENKKNLFYVLYLKKGIVQAEYVAYRDEIMKGFNISFPEDMSTIVSFMPDSEIFGSTIAHYSKTNLQYTQVVLKKFYNKEVRIEIDGKIAGDKFNPYQFEFIKRVEIENYDGQKKAAAFYVNFECDPNMSVTEETGSVNSLVVNRGIHLLYTKSAYATKLKTYFNLYHDYLTAGFKLNVICVCGEVDFSSQTKENCVKLDGLKSVDVSPVLEKEFLRIFKENHEYFQLHINRLNEYADSLTKISAIEKVKEVVNTMGAGNKLRSRLPSSVKDAASEERSKCELFIVEGKSAGGTLIKARDPMIHAIMELKGVPLNSINLDLEAIMNNEEMCSIIKAIGAGVNEYFDIDSCRYGKIILAADSDADGSKINSLILGFFARKMTFLIEKGYVYIARSPLYEQGDLKVYPGENPEEILDMNKPFKRYKGLGEINVTEAKNFFFNPSRQLMKVTLNNLEYVLSLLTTTLHRKDLMIEKGIIKDVHNTGIY